MLDRDEIREFFRWLEQASDKELEARQRTFLELLDQVTDREVRFDTRFLLKHLEREMVSRKEIAKVRQMRKK